MFDLSLFRKPAFTGVSLATFAIGAGMFAMLTYLTLYLQDLLGLSPFQGGLRLLPLTVPVLHRSPGHPDTGRTHATRGLARCRTVCCRRWAWPSCTGCRPTRRGPPSWPASWSRGLGIGIANPAIAKIALGVVSPERSGMASGISNTFRIGGLATGVAGLGALFQGRLSSSLSSAIGHPAQAVAAAVAAEGTHGADARMLAKAHLTQAAGAAFSIGINDLLVTGAVIVFVGALFSLPRAAQGLSPVVAPGAAPGTRTRSSGRGDRP